ncbi:MAG: RluA family pseudouridine synthase [Alphaproteobacteria bacterium]
MAIVGQEDAGKRLDRFVAEALSPLSRSRAKALVEGGHVALVGGRTIREPAHRVKLQEEWRVDVPPAEITTLPAQAMDLAVAYEDDHLIVVNKPAGLVVHPAPGNPDRTLVNALLAHCGDSLTGIGGERRPGIVHRLDKDTSGLLVVAKTGIVHADLVSQFSARTVHRRYLALVHGQPRPATGHFSGAIGRSPHDRKRMAVVDSGGRDAATAYCRLLSFAPYASLLLCRLATGRTHQIRVHLSHAGHPLVGDPVYGRRRPRRASTSHQTEMEAAAATLLGAFPRQALHAASLGFRHPASGDSMLFRAEPPADFNKLGAALAGLSGGQWPDTLARAEILDQMLD